MFTKKYVSSIARFALVFILLVGMFGLQPVRPVSADTLIVTNSNSSGAGSLPDLIVSAPSGSTITFDPSLAGQTITLPSDINIIRDLTIDGLGLSPQVTISGGDAYHLEVPLFNCDLTISNLTFTNGYNAGNGGAIEFRVPGGNLTLSNVAFNNNSADGDGGAISFLSGSFVISNSMFSQNWAGGRGGALNANGTGPLTVTNGTFIQNSAGDDGGAILVGASSNQIIVDSTFTQNETDGDGGAILDNGSLSIKSTTIDHNMATGSGGGIAFYGNGHPTIINSTITQNQAGSYGGAIYMNGNIDIKIFNNTLAENESTNGSEIHLAGLSNLIAYNTIFACWPGASTCYSYTGSTDFSLTNSIMETGTLADFGLAELADNGGPTETMALMSGSSLIDAGDDSVCTNAPVNNLDQRGMTRLRGSHCDIGAFENDTNLTFRVNSTLDIVDTNPGDGICETALGNKHCTLRGALQEANEYPGMDTIILSGDTYTLTIPQPGGVLEDAANNGDLDIYSDLVIVGAGSKSTIIDGNGSITHDRVFHILGDYDVNMSKLTIRGGRPMPNNGGGIYNYGGTLTLREVIISGNTAGSGGGLINGGNANIFDSTIKQNSANSGGGIRNDHILNIFNSTISDNTSDGPGGAIENHATIQMSNSTVSNNQTIDDRGGCIYVGFSFYGGPASALNLINTTITGNLADTDGNGNSDGGGIYMESTATVTLKNTILAGNAGADGFSDCFGTLTSQGYNLIERTGSCTVTGNTTGNLIGLNPKLHPLLDNGGVTFTHALLTNSPAIDAGDDANCSPTDQRGVTRPQGSHCDIGAYEANQIAHSIPLLQSWNLVSFKVHPTNTSISSVLSSIEGNYDLVYAWDASGAHAASGNWLKADNLPESPDSLTVLNETMGFWVHMTAADTLEVVGTVPPITNVPLLDNAGGWNLVAYPSIGNGSLPTILTDHGVGSDLSKVYAYHPEDTADSWKLFDTSAPIFVNDLTQLVPVFGYWVKVTADHTWVVNYGSP